MLRTSEENVTEPSIESGINPPLSLRATLGGRSLLVFGGTGFLGKVWLALVLSRLPEIQQIYLVVRPKKNLDVETRFQKSILSSDVFRPLREQYGEKFEAWVSSKVTPIQGEVSQAWAGVDEKVRDQLRGRVDAIVNVAGIVNFHPPLDEALQVNAVGCQNLVQLARDLGECPVLHTSTCFTAGRRTGEIEEQDPREIPFPFVDRLDPKSWDAEREIQECLEAVEALRQKEKVAPEGRVLPVQLTELGMERAQRWGWPNTYTYTKSLGEQVIAQSGLPFTIVRPAIVESTLAFPFPGWNEGINTSAPFIFFIRQGGLQIPGSKNNLDLIPCDLVCSALLLALGELLEGRAHPVYQAAASDTNPCTMARFFELSGLHKRRLYRESNRGGRFTFQRNFESALLSKKQYEAYGPRTLARGAETVSELFRTVGKGPLERVFQPAAKGLSGFAKRQKLMARIIDTFLPFVAEFQYVFRTDAVRAAFARLVDDEKELFPWRPEEIDWRTWFLEIHAPALESYVFPEMETRLERKKRRPRA